MDTLHRNLLLGKVGQFIVKWSIVIFVVLLISGIVLWFPRNTAAVKQRLKFNWKETTRWRRKNYDIHNIIGFYAFLLLFIIALTGLVYSFTWLDKTVQTAFNGGKVSVHKMATSDTTQKVSQISLEKIVTDVSERVPTASSINITMPKTKKATLNIFIPDEGGKSYKSISINFDQYTGDLLKTTTFADKNNGQKFRSMNIDIHDGGVGGIFGRIIAFLISLTAASLPITGFLIWFSKKKKQIKSTPLINKDVVSAMEPR